MSCLLNKALYIVMSFLVLWSICWNYSLVSFKDDAEYLTNTTAQVFIPLTKILLCSLVSSSFLVFLRHTVFFLYICMFKGVCFQYSQIFVGFLFFDRSDFVLI